jgi:hypothetical protein
MFPTHNFAIGIATLPASLIFGALYQVYGALVAFGWGADLALVAVVLLAGVKGQPHPKSLIVGSVGVFHLARCVTPSSEADTVAAEPQSGRR